MLTKEKFLKDKISLHIKSPESNEDYVKLIQKLIDLGWETYNNTSAENFVHYTWIYLPHINEEYFEIHPRDNPDGQKEIQVSDIIGENNQFEVGKWYKYNNWYIKLKEINHANIFIASDYIDNEKIYAGNLNRFTCGDADFQKVLLTDLSEIQKYLPDGHVDKLPKPLTADDLVEGEIYYCLNNTICLWGKKDSTHSINPEIKDFWKAKPGGYNNNYGFRLTTSEEKKWLLTCIKQDEFIEQSELDKYDDGGNLIQVKPTFEFNKWYKSNNADGLFFIQSKNTGYGFRSNHVNYWFINNADFEWNIDGLAPASSEEVSERLLNYAKEKYLKDYVYFCPLHKENCVVIKQNFDTTLTPTHQAISESDMGLVFLNGQWAEVISKPETKETKEMQLSDLKHPVFNIGDKVRVIADSLKEFNSSWSNGNNARYKKGYEGIITSINGCKSSFKEVTTWYYLDGNRDNAISCNLLELAEPVKKEFDRNWYVEVNSQEEADKVFDWLRAQGEPVINTNEWLKFRVNIDKYITYWKENNTWFVNSLPRENTYQKQLSDIIPNYSSEPKVNRNVYYEVSNQEQYEEILNWLESKGENVYTGSNVTKDWKYIYKDNFWCLYNIKPNLPKANFTFKNKQKCTFNEGIVIKKEEKPIIEKKLISKVKKSIEF